MKDLTIEEFKEIIKAAGYDYHTIYGYFPTEMYIDIFRICYLQHKKIAFLNLKPAGVYNVQPQLLGGVSLDVTECHFFPISGYSYNDVYVKMPELPHDGYRSGAALARMASPERNCKK